MNNLDSVIKLFSETAKKRCEKADENRKNGVPDPLNDLVDHVKQNIITNITKKKFEKKK